MYKLLNTIYLNGNSKTDSVLRLSDNAFIPFDLANTDYQTYLTWLEKGGIPELAEETV
jgi:hypothetical protein